MAQGLVPPRHGTSIVVHDMSSKYLFDNSMRSFGLSIRLRMKGRRVRQSCTQQLHKTRPKCPGEARISIAHYGLRDPKIPYYSIEK